MTPYLRVFQPTIDGQSVGIIATYADISTPLATIQAAYPNATMIDIFDPSNGQSIILWGQA
jgi:hypothetical protein